MLELQLRVQLDEGRTHDLVSDVARDHTIRDLALAIAHHLGMPIPEGHLPKMHRARDGTLLGPELTVIDSGLVSGDLVQLGLVTTGSGSNIGTEANTAPIRRGLTCDVVGGPSSGTSLPLSEGSLTIGRDPACDLTLDDPTVSKRHAKLMIDATGAIEVAPLEQVTNPVLIDGSPISRPAPLPHGSILEVGSCALVIRHYEPEFGAERDQLGQIPFNRTPYRHPDLTPVEIRGPGTPPAPYQPRPLALIGMLAPAVAGIALAIILDRWMFLMFALLSPVTMLGSWLSERRHGGATYKQQVATFERRLRAWEQRYDDALLDERKRRLAAAPDLAELVRRAQLRTADLWARNRHSQGFLEFRLGLGDAPATTTTQRPTGVNDDPDQRIEDVIDARRYLASIPITTDLATHGVLAVHGSPQEVETTVSSVVLQAATLHSPDDLVLAAALHPRRTLTDWVKWLPQTRSVASPVDGDHLAIGEDAANDLLRRLIAVVDRRREMSWPRVLLILDELVEADSLLVSTLLEAGPRVGLSAVWVGQDRAMVPRQATTVLDVPAIGSGERARLWSTDPAEPEVELTPDRLSVQTAPHFARALAPVRDASSASAASSIPRLAPLLETAGLPTIDRDTVIARWKRRSSYGLKAPIGIGPDGPLKIDLVEHGPHALIAGTSGAGKSELLQSFIAALVIDHPPTRLNLLFIDYKGGASSNVFRDVAHTVGTVTNLSADLAMRALVSLRAELDRRMRLLEGRAKDLAEMLERHPEQAPASLVIVVDEFATLIKEIPDFVAGMVDIAQRGRSLGIHLILATQRPAGAVNDDILANTNLRISLRVLDPADSSSILGSAEAASIPGPLRGRGFARLGTGGLIEFQGAFSGVPHTATHGQRPIRVTDFPSTGEVTLHPAPDPDFQTEGVTQLDAVLAAVVDATQHLGLSRGRRPWLEDLPRTVFHADVRAGVYGQVPPLMPGRDILVGVVDLPETQTQRPHIVDLEASGGLLIYGAGGSGRTSALRTVIASAIDDATPAAVEIFVLDFAGRGLEPLRGLPHVASVTSGDDLEQATRVLMHLEAEVARRQKLLASHRADTLSSFNAERADERLSRLLLVLDGYEGFERTFERGNLYVWSEILIETVLAGRSAGLHLVASADRRLSVPAALSNSVSEKLILGTADVEGLIDLGVPADTARNVHLGRGRALRPPGTTLQIALVGTEASNSAQTAALEAQSHARAQGLRTELPELPDDLPADELSAPDPSHELAFTLGVADLTGEVVTSDVRLHHLAVIGPAESGRSTALRRAATDLDVQGTPVWVLSEPTSPLANMPLSTGAIATRPHDHTGVLEAALQAARPGSPQVVAIDRVEQIDAAAAALMEQLIDHEQVRILAGFDDTTITSFAQPPWMNVFKRSRRILLLQPDELPDLNALTPSRIRLRPRQRFPAGRGVFVTGREWRLIQVGRDR